MRDRQFVRIDNGRLFEVPFSIKTLALEDLLIVLLKFKLIKCYDFYLK